jgi:hypothetical protein
MEVDSAVQEAVRLFKAADTDKNGSISFAEWCAAGIKMQKSKQSKDIKESFGNAINKKIKNQYNAIEDSFNLLDSNGDKKID